MFVLAGCLCACQKEDPVVPNGMSNPFATLPGATDEETKLREDFYKATGCHLLFNDTLRHEYKGLDGNGNPFYETELLPVLSLIICRLWSRNGQWSIFCSMICCLILRRSCLIL